MLRNCCIGASLVAGVVAIVFSHASAAAQEAFHDTFDTLDRERWFVSHDWTNGAHQGCTWRRDRVSVEDGRLVLSIGETSDPDGPRAVDCGEIQTRTDYGHGVYETRMRAAKGSGLVSAFFTYTGEVHGNPHDEIDVEIAGKNVSRFEANYFVDGTGDHVERIALPVPADEAFIHYAFEWADGVLRWFVDGALVHEVRGDDLPDARQRIYFSLWNGTERSEAWLGPFDEAAIPTALAVDWVAFTPAGERCAFAQSITCAEDWDAASPDRS